jgi:hypothetical protein
MGGMFGGGGGGGGGGSATPDYGSGVPGAGYTNPRDSVGSPYTSSYTPQTATPFLQSIMAQQGGSPLQQNNTLGLPSLQSMFNMPQAGAPSQATGIQQLAPMMPYVGSTYRPDMAAINKNLNNVAPSVELQARLAAEEAARKKAEQDAYDAANPKAQSVSWND